jgi:hypothetical protein
MDREMGAEQGGKASQAARRLASLNIPSDYDRRRQWRKEQQ